MKLRCTLSFARIGGLSETELARTPEEDANRLYTRYVMDCGLRGDLLDLLVALTPCSLGYAEIGARLLADPDTKLNNNPYRPWIELYGGNEFQEGAASPPGSSIVSPKGGGSASPSRTPPAGRN